MEIRTAALIGAGAVGAFFIGLSPEKELVISKADTEAEYYINGEVEKPCFGVMSDGNLFEPQEDIR